ncbi:MAG: rhodanese-like domain-containing protein [Saprospiraceae bacterium]|nr:rhodanese-like domain-containing protein [Saprospiraceae bacterium]
MSWDSFLKNIFGGAEETETEVATEGGPRNENLSGRAFKQQLQETENAVLLDVRTAGEYAGGTIPGAKNIDYLSPAFMQKVEKLDKNATYFLFCRSGNRSGQACKMMLKMGFNVRNLSGGIGAYPG